MNDIDFEKTTDKSDEFNKYKLREIDGQLSFEIRAKRN